MLNPRLRPKLNAMLTAGSIDGIGDQVDPNGWEAKLLLAAFAAALGFVSAIVLDRIRSIREPRQRLSWEASEELGVLSIRPSLKERVRILYGDIEVENLFLIRLKLQNTGNRVIKDERLRIDFPDHCQILEAHPEPLPPEEYALAEQISESTSTRRVYTLGHLEAGQSVELIVTVSGESVQGWTIHGHNADGDVAFAKRDFISVKDDQAHIEPFLKYLLLLLVVPPIVAYIPLGYLAAAGLGFLLLILVFLHIGPAIRVLSRAITVQGGSRAPVASLSIAGEAQPQVVIASTVTGGTIRFDSQG